MNNSSTLYAQQLDRNIDVWLKRTEGIAEGNTKGLYKKFPNLLRLIKQALASPQTRTPKLALLVKQAYWIPNEYGRWPVWEPLINHTLSIFKNKHHSVYIELLIQQGKCFSRTRQMNRAINCHKLASDLAIDNDLHLLIDALYNLCFNFRVLQNFEYAINYGEKALNTIKENFLENPELTAIIINEIGRIYSDLGNIENQIIAEKTFRDAFEYVKKDISSNLFGKILVNLGISLQNQDRLGEAEKIYLKAMEHFDQSQNELDKSRFWNSFGVLFFQMEQYQKAESAFRQANSPILKNSGDVFVQASLNQNLGNVLILLNRLEEAENYIIRAIYLWEKMNNLTMVANSLGSLGELKVKQNYKTDAITNYEKALNILDTIYLTEFSIALQKRLLIELNELMQKNG